MSEFVMWEVVSQSPDVSPLTFFIVNADAVHRLNDLAPVFVVYGMNLGTLLKHWLHAVAEFLVITGKLKQKQLLGYYPANYA